MVGPAPTSTGTRRGGVTGGGRPFGSGQDHDHARRLGAQAVAVAVGARVREGVGPRAALLRGAGEAVEGHVAGDAGPVGELPLDGLAGVDRDARRLEAVV